MLSQNLLHQLFHLLKLKKSTLVLVIIVENVSQLFCDLLVAFLGLFRLLFCLWLWLFFSRWDLLSRLYLLACFRLRSLYFLSRLHLRNFFLFSCFCFWSILLFIIDYKSWAIFLRSFSNFRLTCIDFLLRFWLFFFIIDNKSRSRLAFLLFVLRNDNLSSLNFLFRFLWRLFFIVLDHEIVFILFLFFLLSLFRAFLFSFIFLII